MHFLISFDVHRQQHVMRTEGYFCLLAFPLFFKFSHLFNFLDIYLAGKRKKETERGSELEEILIAH